MNRLIEEGTATDANVERTGVTFLERVEFVGEEFELTVNWADH